MIPKNWTAKLSNDKHAIVCSIHPTGTVIEHIYNAPSTELTKSNAKLIAAAPEMLETLTKLKNGLNYMEQTKEGEHILNDDYVQLIIRTIILATL